MRLPKDLADLGQGRAGSQHRGGGAVAQAVGTCRCDAGTLAGTPHDSGHVGDAHRADWSPHAQEQRPALDPGAPVGQVGSQRLTDIDGQGEAIPTRPLAPHHELAVVPVDVVEGKPCDLAGTKPEP